MVNCGRNRILSTGICIVIFVFYFYYEFLSNNVVRLQPTPIQTRQNVSNSVERTLIHAAEAAKRQSIVKDENPPGTEKKEAEEKEDGLFTERPPLPYTEENSSASIVDEIPQAPENSQASNSTSVKPPLPVANPDLNTTVKPDFVEPPVRVRSFVKNQPKMILLLAQQRVGSTFIGGIFDKNTDAFYVYEPLEGIYTHLYGTAKGWNVPLDLHFHWNGSYRHLPPTEMAAVSKQIEQLFTCDVSNMLTELLVHEFWTTFKQTQVSNYAKCIRAHKVSVNSCQVKLKSACNQRVGQNLPKEAHCEQQLAQVFSGQPAEEPFKQYKYCMDEQRKTIKDICMPMLQKVCSNKPLHVIKTVRLDMETVVPLMEKYPNMRVIHLIRDPRSVVLSRLKAGWAAHGSTNLNKARVALKNKSQTPGALVHVNGTIDYEDFSLADEIRQIPKPPNGLASEALMYCTLTRKDILTRRHLEEKFPGSTYQMIYDHMITHPMHELERIYKFIDEPIPRAISDWVETVNSSSSQSQSIASKWRKDMTPQSAKLIDTYCQSLYDTIEYHWPDP